LGKKNRGKGLPHPHPVGRILPEGGVVEEVKKLKECGCTKQSSPGTGMERLSKYPSLLKIWRKYIRTADEVIFCVGHRG